MMFLLEFLIIVVPLAGYFFRALGLYSIAQSRRIKNAWISWVPVVNAWMLGCVSDQYRFVTRGESTHRRTVLLVMPILKIAAFVAMVVAGVVCGVLGVESGSVPDVTFQILFVIWAVVYLAQFILEQMATFDLHRSCNPETAALFLVLGILIPVLQSVFIFINRKSELGMPPRQHIVN